MASQGGLTRRRGAGGGGGVTSPDADDESSSSRVTSPVPRQVPDRTPETAYEAGENGHKIAFDPRDISESAERSKQPKLTLMEEILLLGLKDKQVTKKSDPAEVAIADHTTRDTSRSGTITFHMPSEAA
jgi:golgi phosphoprotein 3